MKNLFVLAPVVFAKHLTDGVAVARALTAFALFCALSSAIYLWNDVVDVERDRAHPRKRHRPIAAGRLSIAVAQTAALLLASAALVGGLLLDARFAVTAAAYLALNLAYSSFLKHVAYVDVGCLATGFLFRVLAGAFAVRVESSPYLLLCTVLVAAFSGLGKRAHELQQLGEAAAAQRPTLRGYDLPTLKAALAFIGAATLVAYTAYTLSQHTVAFFGTARMIYTAPFCLLGLGRFLDLAILRPREDSPTDEMLRDIPFILNLAAWGVVTTLIIYLR
jgi:4-hydroxybenzoate polyprenyltransferase